MSFRHHVDFKCDSCGTNYMINPDEHEYPPGWLSIQLSFADSDGAIMEQEYSFNLCSCQCLLEYTKSQMKKIIITAYRQNKKDDEESSPPPNSYS